MRNNADEHFRSWVRTGPWKQRAKLPEDCRLTVGIVGTVEGDEGLQ
jgi:hypothetical protein